MEKILIAIDAINPDTSTIDFACFLARLTKSTVTGLLLENLSADEKPVVKQLHGMPFMEWEVDKSSREFREKMELIQRNMTTFKELCIKGGINYNIYLDKGSPAQDLVEESRFADIIVTDAETSFNKKYEGWPTEFVRDILKRAECPVIIAPKSFEAIDEIVFTYNDTPSSFYAIKQFTYLFPELGHKKATVIHINKEGIWELAQKKRIKSWMHAHYADLHFEVMKGTPNDILFDELFKRKNIFLVMGAYGRNALSQFFKRSHADLLIEILAKPIFIAHL